MALACGISLSAASDMTYAQLRLMDEQSAGLEHERMKRMAKAMALAVAAGFGSREAADSLNNL